MEHQVLMDVVNQDDYEAYKSLHYDPQDRGDVIQFKFAIW